jgi:hypothetical protein
MNECKCLPISVSAYYNRTIRGIGEWNVAGLAFATLVIGLSLIIRPDLTCSS